ncbi:MAG: asparagine synthase (glutamine-hydrolyzing) [Pseudomonadota bacterium]|nr:asparagine synthase (glutamine-hydrolyzing) [Pseudomonadota bacterium]
MSRMTDVIKHRGPDDRGTSKKSLASIGMRRLSIIDLSTGHQPMHSDDGRIAIVFNGEIYNFRELAAQLRGRGHVLRTNSDTEVILRLYEERGIDCLEPLRGMFAFAIIDERLGRLFVARDRLGVKPLYYYEKAGKLLFGSEIKSILECPDVPREPNEDALDAFLTLRYSPGPETMFRGLKKLPAGHFMIWREGQLTLKKYWEPIPYEGNYRSDSAYQEEFEALFQESVRLRLVSDVPVGAYLSGGLDSSSIVATMASLSPSAANKIKTFSVGFDWEGDELAEAREVADHLGTDHSEILCRPEDMSLLPRIVWHSDEPLGDAIVIPTYLLSREARKSVKVVLTGEGADETMAGYTFHRVISLAQRYKRLMPRFLHNGLVMPLVTAAPVSLLNRYFDYPADLGREGKQRVLRYLSNLHGSTIGSNYRLLISLFSPEDKDRIYSRAFKERLTGRDQDNPNLFNGSSAYGLDALLHAQFKDWLPDNILLRQDKMSMANSVEARVPFLDHKLVEFLQTVPPHLKLASGGLNKVLLRNYAANILPDKAARRKKRPFYIPVEKYFSHPSFMELVKMTLDSERVRRRGLFKPKEIARLCDSLRRNEFLFVKQVVALVMLELWFMIFIDRELTPET